MIVVGIDPGLKGALARFDVSRLRLAIAPMPTMTTTRNRKDKTIIDEDGLADLLRSWGPAVVWIEDVYSRAGKRGPNGENYGDGVVQAFSFGEGKGILKGVAAGLRIPREYVAPQVWKADLGLIGAAKNASKPRAQGLMPGCAKLLSSEGKAEAALIGLWACLQMGYGAKMAALLPG